VKRGASALCKRDFRVLYLDGVHFSIRHGEKADATIILTALGVDLEGNKEVLARRSCAEESKEGWLSLLQDVRTRGATQIDLIVTDGHDGRLSAVAELFSATPRQRCLVHTQRNVLAAIPRRERGEVQAELVGIWEQPTKQEALIQLAANHQPSTRSAIGEAVRSLAEDEEHSLSVLCVDARACTDTFRPPMRLRVWEVNVRQRDFPDRRVHHREQLPDHRLGDHSGYPLAQNLAVMELAG
jgi:transposase-like protein